MNKTTYIRELNVLMDSDQYEKALTKLNANFKHIRPELSLMEIAELYQKWGICFYYIGDYKKACYKLKSGLYLLAHTSDHLIYARIKNVLGLVRMKMGRITDALEAFNESYVFFKRIRRFDEVHSPLNSMAKAHFMLGNIGQSIEVLRQLIAHLVKLNKKDSIEIAELNLSRVLLISGEFKEATEILNTFNIRKTTGLLKANLLILQGMLNTFRLDRARAVTLLKKAKAIFTEHNIARDIAVCNEYLGLNEYLHHNYRKAEKFYRLVLDMREPTASAVAQATRMLAEVHIAEKNIPLAEEAVIKAEQAITKINERIELGALWRAYGQLYVLKGEHDKAREYFGKSAELLRTIGARFELAQTCYVCGQSPAFEREERLSYLSSAHSLFGEMEVIPRLNEIKKLLDNFRAGQSTWQLQNHNDNSAPVVIARNGRMREIVAQCEQMAPHNINVLLTGATGTGKDLLAQYIHHVSGRTGQFVMVNSAAIPNEMVEAELFGYSKGAFTGADHERMGLIEMAADGTLYLNEIVDASLLFQAKLLEVLETHQVRRLGENEIRQIDFRLICATNHDLEEHLAQNKFRPDFYHRIKETHIHLPNLDDRSEDIPDLALHFMKSLQGFAETPDNRNEISEICRLLAQQRWIGNVRELRAELKRLWVVAHGELAGVLQLVRNHVEQDSRDILIGTLHDTEWNQRETARRMGISDGTVRNLIRKYAI